MKRVGYLWDRLVSFENLLRSAEAACKGKRFRPDVAREVEGPSPGPARRAPLLTEPAR